MRLRLPTRPPAALDGRGERVLRGILRARATGQGARHFGRVTESIFLYSKGSPIWNPAYTAYTPEILARDYKYIDEATGEKYRLMPVDGPGGAAKGNQGRIGMDQAVTQGASDKIQGACAGL